jgi:hypothetical protein
VEGATGPQLAGEPVEHRRQPIDLALPRSAPLGH